MSYQLVINGVVQATKYTTAFGAWRAAYRKRATHIVCPGGERMTRQQLLKSMA